MAPGKVSSMPALVCIGAVAFATASALQPCAAFEVAPAPRVVALATAATAPAYPVPPRGEPWVHFGKTAVLVRVSRDDTGAKPCRVGLLGFGYDRGLVPAGLPLRLSPGEGFHAYWRPGVLEWYVDSGGVIEQGFTLSCPTGKRPRTATLDVAISGALNAAVTNNGAAIEFSLPDGRPAFRYDSLHVHDAAGNTLAAWLRLAGQRDGTPENTWVVRVQVDVADAVFPVTVDPLISRTSWHSEGKQAYALLGTAVAPAGDVNGDGYDDLVAGAPGYGNGEEDEGAVFVFHGSAAGIGTVPAWRAEGGRTGGYMGNAVAGAGDLNGDGYDDIAVGAPSYVNENGTPGRVLVFLGSPQGLGAVPSWRFEADAATGSAGFSVSAAGDVNADGFGDLVVGAPYANADGSKDGAVLVFHGSSAGLSESPDWIARGDEPGANFGASVSLAGDVNGDGFADIVAGAPGSCRACVYRGSENGLEAAPAWTVTNEQAFSGFGAPVSGAGDVNGDGFDDVLLGAGRYDWGDGPSGAAFLYHGSPTGLSPSEAWEVPGKQANGQFGAAVARAGDVNGDGFSDIVIGACTQSISQPEEGAAYLFLGSPSGLASKEHWSAAPNLGHAWFGRAVAPAGDLNGDGYADLAVSAPAYTRSQDKEGRVFVYYGSAAGSGFRSDWVAYGEQSDGWFGAVVAKAGDVNGDGCQDFLVAAGHYKEGEQGHVGKVSLFAGSPSGPGMQPAWTAKGATNKKFGAACASGDFNGDGFSDILIGSCPYYIHPEDWPDAQGYYGSPGGLNAAPDWLPKEQETGDLYGRSVAGADVNGDGYTDALVGAPHHAENGARVGRVYLYLGSSRGLPATHDAVITGDTADSHYALTVSGAGDVNGDGYEDVLVGANMEPILGRGEVSVHHGTPQGICTTPALKLEGEAPGSLFGDALAGVGDIDSDGYDDVLVGAPYQARGEEQEGVVYLYCGSPEGLNPVPRWTMSGGQAIGRFGSEVGDVGDINGDGFPDVVIGAPFFDSPYTDEGRASVYLGNAFGLASSPFWSGYGGKSDSLFGSGVAGVGDVNGDGCPDILVGAATASAKLPRAGAAFLYCGSRQAGSLPHDWVGRGGRPELEYGKSVSSMGDVDGDGFDDLVAGECNRDTERADPPGRVVVYRGSPAGLSSHADWTITGDASAMSFGWQVDGAGDVNADGFSDILVAAPARQDSGAYVSGCAYLFLGSREGPGTTPAWQGGFTQRLDAYGLSASMAGDVNGDGYTDVIVGAPRFNDGKENEGRVYVYYGAEEGLGPEPCWTAGGNSAEAHLGWSVSEAGDVNGDGFGDVIVGAPYYGEGQTYKEGRAVAYYGSPHGLSADPDWSFDGGKPKVLLGYSVSGLGDVNGDGYDDVAVTAPLFTNGAQEEGRALLFLGSPEGLCPAPAWTMESNSQGAGIASVAAAGDFNGDSLADVLVASDNVPGEYGGRGCVWLYLGQRTGLDRLPALAFPGPFGGPDRAYAAAGGGDLNGDGFDDLVLSQPGPAPADIVPQRAVLVFHGRDGGRVLSADGVYP